jgi:hypothetical protein
MKNLPVKDKVFWLNFFQSILVIVVTVLLLSGYPDFSLKDSYIIVSFLGLIILSGMVARTFSRHEELGESIEIFLIKNNMSKEEFHKKYGDLIEIYREVYRK